MNTNLNPRQRNDSRSRRRGIMLILFALLLAPLLALIGLTIDGGRIYFEKRRMQAAADGGAFGAAHEILRGNDGLVVSAGRDDTKLNGFDNGLSDITVTVNRPPSTGPNSGNNDAVEVIIERPIPTTFMKIIMRENTTVRARAVAGVEPELDPACIIALDPSAAGAITISGTTDINVEECSILAASDNPQAITINGGVSVYTGGLGFGASDTGSVQNGQGVVDPDPVPAPGATDYYKDYYENLFAVEPAPGDYDTRSTSRLNISTDTALLPGYYAGGIKITGGTVTLAAGIYVVDGLEVTGGTFKNAVDNGASGVMIFNTGASMTDNIHIGGNVTVQLYGIYKSQTMSENGPIPDQYENLLFFNSRFAAVNNGSISDATLLGNSNSTYDGIMYFPTIKLNYGGTSEQGGTFAMIISNTLELSGTPQLGPDWEGAGREPSFQQISLLE